ncbi:MAG: DUF4054 domain-containing protein [Treponema sp.]|jgi:hypothetical protein|nr:DUF4054 domain-containing protein [Treponema sp.]
MALSPRQIIAAICPELSGSPSLPVFLEMAAEVTGKGFYGKIYPYALAYLSCHLFTVAGGGSSTEKTVMNMGGGAPVASMSEGGLSISFAQGGTTAPSSLGSTKYGKMYLDLRKSRPTMGVNSGGLYL